MQFGLSATASFPGFDLAGEIKSGAMGDKMKDGEGNALSGFEALLAALVSGGEQSPTNINIDIATADPANQQLADALSEMAEALMPLAQAFDDLQIPSGEQLDAARNALGKLVDAINAHPSRPDISLTGPIGAFAAQLNELRAAGSDVAKQGASDFAKVGHLLGHLDRMLNQIGFGAGGQAQANAAGSAAPNIHQIIDRLNTLAEELPSLPAKLEAQLKNAQAIGNSTFDAQTNAAAQKGQWQAVTGQAQSGQNSIQAALNGEQVQQNVRQQTAQQANTTLGRNGDATTEPDILAQIARMGEAQAGKEGGRTATDPQTLRANVQAATAEGQSQAPERMTFAQATKEANLQAAATYPEMQRANQAQATNAPLTSELDAVETGNEKLFAQNRTEQFQQQVNHIEAVQNRNGPRQVNIPAVAFEIVRQVRAGMQRFEVRLDPPEMGRIDVQMEMEGKNVTARLVVERAETLDLLQRDARALERALQQAGLNADRANLQFSLKQDQQGNSFQQSAQNGRDGTANENLADATTETEVAGDVTRLRGTISDSGLNLWV